MNTIETFEKQISEIQKNNNYKAPIAFGLGIRRMKANKVLDILFPKINYQQNEKTFTAFFEELGIEANKNQCLSISSEQLQNVFDYFKPFHNEIEKHANLKLIKQFIDQPLQPNAYAQSDIVFYSLYNPDQDVEDANEAYFKLQCMSQRHVKPHEINLSGVFGKLNNIAWSNFGPILPEDLEEFRLITQLQGKQLIVSHVDKFPYLVNYHLPSGVRIASGSQVRLGAYLGEGTTVMPAGYINFNAGTEGNAMVEGRISAGVMVSKDSDIGGGASIMGTLSGGNKNVISIGSKCLLGANAGTGISLGFGCTVAAGVYITAGSKVSLYNAEKQPIDINGHIVEEGKNIVKGIELNGRDKLLFINDSQTGKLTCRPNPKTIELNESLHKN